ncbi:MAG: hypothetical protein Q7R35_11060 [Elusimicrobiota bacterium]|nr:hypothetical protein [Elusimicrobiota bacterium]
MIEAELKGKCGGLSDQEDALTSTVFGVLKYAFLRPVLRSFLAEAKNLVTGSKYDPSLLGDDYRFVFWSRISAESEIDLELRGSDYRLGIEVKYLAEESGDGQLDRYSKILDHVVYVTLDSVPPAVSKVNPKIFWVSWHELHKILKQRLGSAEGLEIELLQDLIRYLENRGIRSFIGFVGNGNVPEATWPLFWGDKLFHPKETVIGYSGPLFFMEKNTNE